MEDLNPISAGQKGSVVAESINTNMMKIHDAISELEEKLRRMSISQSGGTIVEEDLSLAGVVIVASPETTLAQTLPTEQVFEIPITVYCGNKQLRYDGLDDGYNSYAIDLGDTNIQDKNGITIATVSIAVRDSQIILKMSIKPNVVANFKYEFGLIFRNVRYNKVLGFTVIVGDGENAINVDLSPTTVIINESYSGGTLFLKDAIATYSVQMGNVDITDITQCEVISTVNCECHLDTSNKTIQIKDIKRTTLGPSSTSDMCETFEWTDLDGTQHSVRKPVAGNVKLLFSYVNSNNVLYQIVKTFSFAVNYLGTFKESITNDIHMQVSEKLRTELSDEGLLLTEANKTAIIQDAEKVAISAATLSSSGAYQTYLDITSEQISSLISDVEGNASKIQQTSELLQSTIDDVSGNTSSIKQTATDISLIVSGLTQTGIDIEDRRVTITSDNFIVRNNEGNQTFLIDESGKVNLNVLNAEAILTNGLSAQTINANSATLTNINISGESSFAGVLKKIKTILTKDNVWKYAIKDDLGWKWELEKIGTWLEIQSLPEDADLYCMFPSIYPTANYTGDTRNELDYARSLVGNTLIITNKTTTDVQLTGYLTDKENPSSGSSFTLPPGKTIILTCKIGAYPVEGAFNGLEQVYWQIQYIKQK